MTTSCATCCTSCASSDLATCSSNEPDPYDLRNLLPAGTLSLPLNPERRIVCTHAHAADEWHVFDGTDSVVPLLAVMHDEKIVRPLDFLVRHRFVAITFRAGASGGVLFLRVYVIPFDLAGVQGRLRVRDEAEIMGRARDLLQGLLLRVSQCKRSWEGMEALTSSLEAPLLIKQDIDNRTMAEIYADLPSPKVDLDRLGSHPDAHLAADVYKGAAIHGVRSRLHEYQRQTVAFMLQRELCPADVLDPLYVPLTDMDGQVFFVHPRRMEILRARPMVSQSPGGVLCEELGTGKTIMIISLILATRAQLSTPEESIIDTRPALTPLALRTFPFATHVSARKRATGKSVDPAPRGPRTPSLVETLVDYVRTAPDQARIGYHRAGERASVRLAPHLVDQLERSVPFYHHYDGALPTEISGGRSRRKAPDARPRVVYLTSATLVVVPNNLIAQWGSEILKHCDDRALRVLVLRPEDKTPSARVLASKYDIVLVTHDKFTKEGSMDKDLSRLLFTQLCSCAPLAGSRVPDCRCTDAVPRVSPFLQVRWKRLVVDEGHNLGGGVTNFSAFAKRLNVERRWIVTGTPTTNLLGLALGKQEERVEGEKSPEVTPLATDVRNEDELDRALDDALPSADAVAGKPAPAAANHAGEDTESQSDMSEAEAEDCRPRQWTRHDAGDLRKLGTMITQFLLVPRFVAEPAVYNTQVAVPLLRKAGPPPGSIRVLEQVMASVMVRHRIEDVEKEVVLPPVTQETVLLYLEPHALKSYNVMQAVIAINAVDSERVDQDYMFHPSNAKYLLHVIDIISQIMFWSADDRLYRANEASANARGALKRAFSKCLSEDDIALVSSAIQCLEEAIGDPEWQATQTVTDVPFRVYNVPPAIFSTWSRFSNVPKTLAIPGTAGTNSIDVECDGFMHADRLLRLRQMVRKRPLSSLERIEAWGGTVGEEENCLQKITDLNALTRKRSQREDDGAREEERAMWRILIKGKGEQQDGARKRGDVLKGEHERLQKELTAVRERLGEDEGSVGKGVSHVSVWHGARRRAEMGAASPVGNVRIGGSTSSKLNYILNEVLTHSSTEKFLIFSKSPLTLAFVGEGLDLLGIPHLQFTTKVNARHREQDVTTFETSETPRVFLMELKHGARGLNLVSASRVIFCEPVWQADVESQAIKRAHRIGQRRPISVKTLAIRETAEELMMARREAFRTRSAKVANWAEESEMRQFIENPRFLRSTSTQTMDVPLFSVQSGARSDEAASVHHTDARVVEVDHAQPRKRRNVAFAVDDDVAGGDIPGQPAYGFINRTAKNTGLVPCWACLLDATTRLRVPWATIERCGL